MADNEDEIKVTDYVIPVEALEEMLTVAYMAGYKVKEIKLGGEGLLMAAREHAVRAIRRHAWVPPPVEEPAPPSA